LESADAFQAELVNTRSRRAIARSLRVAHPGQWTEASLRFDTSAAGFTSANELRLLAPKAAKLQIDDLLVFEPSDSPDE
jgi:hypothetical protein